MYSYSVGCWQGKRSVIVPTDKLKLVLAVMNLINENLKFIGIWQWIRLVSKLTFNFTATKGYTKRLLLAFPECATVKLIRKYYNVHLRRSWLQALNINIFNSFILVIKQWRHDISALHGSSRATSWFHSPAIWPAYLFTSPLIVVSLGSYGSWRDYSTRWCQERLCAPELVGHCCISMGSQ